MKLRDVLKPLKVIAPEQTAEPWDNIGLQIGDINQDIKRALLTVDITNEVIDEAIAKECQLIISHHPLIFKPLKNLTTDSVVSRLALKAGKNNLAVYALHTNLDLAENGVNRALGEALGFERGKGLVPLGYQEFVKLVTFVPEENAPDLREALWESGAGFIGNYDHCSFEILGTGRFRPLQGSKPFIGSQGEDENINELRIETVVPLEGYSDLVAKIKKFHPYEEPVIDAYQLQYPKKSRYMGEIIKLKKGLALEVILRHWQKNTFFYGAKKEFKHIAILGGSGSVGLNYALKDKADLFITGELDYHELLLAQEEGLAILLLGHGASEAPVLKSLANIVPVETEIASTPYLTTL